MNFFAVEPAAECPSAPISNGYLGESPDSSYQKYFRVLLLTFSSARIISSLITL